jgi:cholesterol transport system auxiliary component
MKKSDRDFVIERRTLIILGASLPLAACGGLSGLIGPPPASQIYVLRPTDPTHLDGDKVGWALAIAEPDAPGNLDTDRIAITRSTDTADYYANAVWPDALPDIVQGALLQAFDASGLIDSVVRDTVGVRTRYVLKTDIRNFEARYATADGAPTAVVTIAASLISVSDRYLAAHHVAHQESPATANSVDAAVQAMGRALGGVLNDIVRWTLTAVPANLPTAAVAPGSHRHRGG